MLESDERLKIHERAQRSVNELIRLAESGDQLSVILLVMIASQMVDAVNSGVEQRPGLFLKFSRHQIVWPALISRKLAIKLENARLMKTLQLGEGDAYFSKKEWRLSAPSNQAALGLFIMALVRREALKLRLRRKFLTSRAFIATTASQ